jgi:hypothetical protein
MYMFHSDDARIVQPHNQGLKLTSYWSPALAIRASLIFNIALRCHKSGPILYTIKSLLFGLPMASYWQSENHHTRGFSENLSSY